MAVDTLYIEDGYVDNAYFEVIVDSGAIGLQPYFAEDYAETGYAEQRGSVFTMVANTDGVLVDGSSSIVATVSTSTDAYRIIEATANIDSAMTATMSAIVYKNHDASLDNTFTQTTDINYTADPGGLLEYLANLDAQAARFRGTPIDITAQFFTSDSTAQLGNNVEPAATFDSAADLVSACNLTADFDIITLASADISAEFAASANAITFVPKSLQPSSSTSRPWGIKYISVDSADERAPVFDSFTKALGDTSIRLYESSPTFDENAYVCYYTDDAASRFPKNNESDELHIEFFARSGTALVFALRKDNGAPELSLQTSTNNATLYIEQGNSNYDTLNTSIVNNAFVHYVIKIQYQTVKFYADGSLVGTLTSYASDSVNEIWFGENEDTGSANGNFYVDEFRLLKGDPAEVAADSFNFNASSYTVPTTEYSSTGTTQLLLHFNDSYQDDMYGELSGSSNIATTTNLNATLTGLIKIDSTLNSNATLNAQVGKIQIAQSDFQAVASQLTVAGKIGDFFVNADIAASLEINDTLFKNHSADFNIAATQTTTAVKTSDVECNMIGAFTPEITTDGIRRVAADLAVSVNTSATGTRIQEGSANIQVASNIVAVNARARLTNSNMSVATTSTADINRIRSGASDFEAVATQLSSAGKIGDFFVNADVVSSISATVNATNGSIINTVANTNLSCTGSVNRTVAADCNSISSLYCAATTSIDSQATLQSTVSIIAVPKQLVVDQYIYTIPAETRTHSIDAETRNHSVTQETRIYSIEGT